MRLRVICSDWQMRNHQTCNNIFYTDIGCSSRLGWICVGRGYSKGCQERVHAPLPHKVYIHTIQLNSKSPLHRACNRSGQYVPGRYHGYKFGRYGFPDLGLCSQLCLDMAFYIDPSGKACIQRKRVWLKNNPLDKLCNLQDHYPLLVDIGQSHKPHMPLWVP